MWKKPRNRKGSGGELVFRPKTGRNAPVIPIGVVVVKFTHAIARVLKRMKIWVGRGVTFEAGITASFVASLPTAGSGASASLFQGSCDRRVVAAPSVHRASAAFTMAVAVPWAPAPTVSLIDGGRRIKTTARKKSLSGDTPGGYTPEGDVV